MTLVTQGILVTPCRHFLCIVTLPVSMASGQRPSVAGPEGESLRPASLQICSVQRSSHEPPVTTYD